MGQSVKDIEIWLALIKDSAITELPYDGVDPYVWKAASDNAYVWAGVGRTQAAY